MTRTSLSTGHRPGIGTGDSANCRVGGRTMIPGAFIHSMLLLGLLVLAGCVRAEASPWGLRNLELVPGWPEEMFEPLGAGHIAFWLPWQNVEPESGVVYWDTLDTRLQRVTNLAAIPVIVFHPNASWANSTQYSGPIDLDRTTPLGQPTPARGYSELLYGITEAMMIRLAGSYSGLVYLRFFNEPYLDWGLGGADQWVSNIQNFERCLRTFYKADPGLRSSPLWSEDRRALSRTGAPSRTT